MSPREYTFLLYLIRSQLKQYQNHQHPEQTSGNPWFAFKPLERAGQDWIAIISLSLIDYPLSILVGRYGTGHTPDMRQMDPSNGLGSFTQQMRQYRHETIAPKLTSRYIRALNQGVGSIMAVWVVVKLGKKQCLMVFVMPWLVIGAPLVVTGG